MTNGIVTARIFLKPEHLKNKLPHDSGVVTVLLYGVLDSDQIENVVQISRELPKVQEAAISDVMKEMWTGFGTAPGEKFTQALCIDGIDYFAASDLVEQSNFSRKTWELNLLVRLRCVEILMAEAFPGVSVEFDSRVPNRIRRFFALGPLCDSNELELGFFGKLASSFVFWGGATYQSFKALVTAGARLLALTRRQSQRVEADVLQEKRIFLFSYLTSTKGSELPPESKYWGRLLEHLVEFNDRIQFCQIDSRPLRQRFFSKASNQPIASEFGPALNLDLVVVPNLLGNLARVYLRHVAALVGNLSTLRQRVAILGRNDLFLSGSLVRSIVGVTAVKNIMFSIQMRHLLQNTCASYVFYPMEFQGWEALSNQAVNLLEARIVKSYGYPHTALRMGDLRFYRDEVSWGRSKRTPLPSVILSHSPIWGSFLRKQLGEMTKVDLVEALRVHHGSPPISQDTKVRSIFFLSGFTREGKKGAVDFAARIVHSHSRLKSLVKIKFRPHPLASLTQQEKAELKALGIELDSAADLSIREGDLVFVDSQSSVALDAFLMGATVVTVLPQEQIIMSPLAGLSIESDFVGVPEEAISLIDRYLRDGFDGKTVVDDFAEFRLDSSQLERWRKLIFEITND